MRKCVSQVRILNTHWFSIWSTLRILRTSALVYWHNHVFWYFFCEMKKKFKAKTLIYWILIRSKGCFRMPYNEFWLCAYYWRINLKFTPLMAHKRYRFLSQPKTSGSKFKQIARFNKILRAKRVILWENIGFF